MLKSSREKIRVLIADDSLLTRRVLRDALEVDSSIKVIGEARNGMEAVDLALSLEPDVIIMDVVMPKMDGITAIREIMKHKPMPIIVFSSITYEGSKAALDAIEAGALEIIPKPGNLPIIKDLGELSRELVKKVKILARLGSAKLILRQISKVQTTRPLKEFKPVFKKPKLERAIEVPASLVSVIASSTGGPLTLMKIVPKISATLPSATLIVQHMPPLFTKTLAERLDRFSQIVIKEAENGDTILSGHGYVAPGDYHMLVRIKRGKPIIELDKGPKVHGVRPAADITMKSVAKVWGPATVAVVLTGMGCDGTEGAREIKKAGGYVIAQDEQTSIVWGMPKSVIEQGLVDEVLPMDEIGDKINHILEIKAKRCSVKWVKV